MIVAIGTMFLAGKGKSLSRFQLRKSENRHNEPCPSDVQHATTMPS